MSDVVGIVDWLDRERDTLKRKLTALDEKRERALATLDGSDPQDDVGDMTISRDEMLARLETAEARTDGRVGRIEAKVDSFIDAQREFRETMRAEVTGLRDELRADGRFTRWTIAGTGLAVLAVVVAVIYSTAQMRLADVNNVLAAFSAGRSAPEASSAAQPKSPIP